MKELFNTLSNISEFFTEKRFIYRGEKGPDAGPLSLRQRESQKIKPKATDQAKKCQDKGCEFLKKKKLTREMLALGDKQILIARASALVKKVMEMWSSEDNLRDLFEKYKYYKAGNQLFPAYKKKNIHLRIPGTKQTINAERHFFDQQTFDKAMANFKPTPYQKFAIISVQIETNVKYNDPKFTDFLDVSRNTEKYNRLDLNNGSATVMKGIVDILIKTSTGDQLIKGTINQRDEVDSLYWQ